MEEGPEPHELIEKTVEHQHHGHDAAHGEDKRAMMVPAVTAAVLAVCAALGSLLSGHAANQAILQQTKATDQWAYYQANSTKGHIHEVSRDVVHALLAAQGIQPTDQTRETLAGFDSQVSKYNDKKASIQEQAETLEREAEQEFHKHHQFALAVSSFQIGIVLASIFLLVRYRVLYFMSLAAGVVGVVFLAVGLAAA
jgi:hypothetical protein